MSNIEGAKKILEEMNTDHIKARLLDYPDAIVALKKQVRVLREAADEAEQARAMLEAGMVVEIADEVDYSTGKAAFKNVEARAGELLRRKAQDDEYQDVAQTARKARFEVSGLEDELEGIENKFKATRFVSRLLAAELEFMADYDEGEEDKYPIHDMDGNVYTKDFVRKGDWPDATERARRDEQAY